MAKRAMTLMAVTVLGGGVAQADPTAVVAYAPIVKKPAEPAKPAPIKPLVLRLGAPACGNVMFKSAVAEDPLCPVIRNLEQIDQMLRNFEAQLQKPAGTAAPLTLAPATRPGS